MTFIIGVLHEPVNVQFTHCIQGRQGIEEPEEADF